MSPRHEIEHADGSREVFESRTGERVALAVVSGSVLVAFGSLALNFFGGIGGLSTVLGGAGGAVGSTAEASYSAPNAPVVSAVMFEDTAGYATASAFVGSLDDTLAYAIFEWDSLRGTGWDLVTPDTQQANGGHPLRSDTLLAALTASDTFKVRVTHHGALSDLEATSVVDTFVAITVNASIYDPYLPAAWTDTVHYEDFTGLSAPQSFASQNDQAGWADPFYVMIAYACQGGVLNGWTNADCGGQDSVSTTGQPTPPWVWESHLGANQGAGLEWGIEFVDGNGSGAAANLTRVYVRYSIYFSADYTWNSQSNKYSQFNDVGNGFLQGWDGPTQFFWEQISPATDGTCGDTPGQAMLYPNTWTEYDGNAGDTIQFAFTGCSNVGRGGTGKTGIWQHHFICMDFSPSAGDRIISWGMKSADEQGVAGYHNNVTWYYENAGVTGVTDFDGWLWNGTWGGLDKTHDAQSIYFDDVLIMTGSSGSCVTPPSFS